jgi:homoserine dehydrogenase
MKKTVTIILMGFGRVGRAFPQLLEEKRDLCSEGYGLELELKAILELGGGAVFSRHQELSRLLKDAGLRLQDDLSWKPGLTLEGILPKIEPGVLVDCTVSSLKTGEPGLGFLNNALESGWHVATASKGALVFDFKNLMKKARTKGLKIQFSGATAAALPTLDVGLYSLAGAEILGIEGILNGTTNYILTRMDQGLGYESALNEARQKGIAEPDPSMDVEGWDTASKILLISNAVVGTQFTLHDIKVEGITNISPEFLQEAKKEGKAVKLLGKLLKQGRQFRAEVRVCPLEAGHSLFGVSGTDKGITYLTDTMGSITVIGGKSDPRGAAAALLKDILNIYR